jgi:hypothetical protein
LPPSPVYGYALPTSGEVNWGTNEKGVHMGSVFGDERLDRRLEQFQTALLEHPNSKLTQALPKWSQLKAAYRFLK